MKKALIFLVFVISLVFSTAAVQAQEVQVGDVLTLVEPSGNDFQYVYFPKKNFIIKRGGIADMDLVKNLEVEVVSVTYTNDNKTLVTLKRTDGGRFFKSLFSVKAELEGAMKAGELTS